MTLSRSKLDSIPLARDGVFIYSPDDSQGGSLPRRDKSRYAIAREPYEERFPDSRMHHLHPTTRNGEDSEFNLFPWNEKAHTAWHQLFSIMTVREVWSVLSDAHIQIFEASGDFVLREWCLPYRYFVKKEIQRDIQTPHSVRELQEAWLICFGDDDLRSAQRVIRYMMLFMVFGRYADRSDDLYRTTAVLQRLVRDAAEHSDRAWAFRQCFGRMPGRIGPRRIRRMVRRLRQYARGLVTH